MKNPKNSHSEAIWKMLRYIKGTLDYGLSYKKYNKFELIGYCDADYAAYHNTRRSTMGYMFGLGSTAVSW